MKSGYYLNALKAVIIFFAAMPWMFLICYFGDEVRIHFSSINESLQSCAWYAFPLEMQKCIPITMQMAQKAVYVGNFGEIHCTREIFKKVNYCTLYWYFYSYGKIFLLSFTDKQCSIFV